MDSLSTSRLASGAWFPVGGYAPIAVQQALLRYWLHHGRPDSLATLPAGRVRIALRGEDRVTISEHAYTLQRYSVSGLIWGRETVWLDSDQRLMAAVSVDAEFDHFEAVRQEVRPALAYLVSVAARDETQALAELAGSTAATDSGDFALTGATLIDGTGAPPVPKATVVVRQGRIAAAGARVKLPPGLTVVDARGKTVLPGRWDMHAHYEQVEWGPIYLAAGVTTVRDVGNEFDFIRSVRDAIAAGQGIGPRLLLAGVVDGDSPTGVGIERANTPEEAVSIVHRYHAAGFAQMKIYSSVKPEIVRTLAAEAHRLGMTVTGHVPEGMDGYQGVEAGMDRSITSLTSGG